MGRAHETIVCNLHADSVLLKKHVRYAFIPVIHVLFTPDVRAMLELA
jgi:hypothetical protein